MTFLSEPVALWPLLGTRRSLVVAGWLRDHRRIGLALLLLINGGLRAWGMGFLVMLLMVNIVEGKAGASRTDWDSVLLTLPIVFLGFYLSHAVSSILRCAGLRDRVHCWSYLLGGLVSLIIFMTPLRP